MALKKKTKARKTIAPRAVTAVRGNKHSQIMNLARLTAAEMMGFIIFEIALWALIWTNILPPAIVIKRIGLLEISMNTGYLAIIGLVSVLVASFWIAILVQFDVIRLEHVDMGI